MLLDDPVKHGWDWSKKNEVNEAKKIFQTILANLLISYEKIVCDNDVDNDFEVNFDDDDDDFSITNDKKRFSDEDWKIQIKQCAAKHCLVEKKSTRDYETLYIM